MTLRDAIATLLADPLDQILGWAQIKALAEGAVGGDAEGYPRQAAQMIEIASHATR